MSTETKRYIAQAVIQHLDGNMDLFHRYVEQAQDEYERYKHLYTAIGDIVRAKGETA
jgi:uncharacterized caspase-like protein